MTLGLSLLVACQPTAPVDDADPNGTLTTIIGSEPVLDPQLATGSGFSEILMVFEPLLRLDPKTLQPVPAAARALPEISADGLTYRFTIRDDAKYSDGAPVRARDFAYTFYRLCDPSIKGFYASVAYVVVGCADWSGLDPKKEPPDRLRAARDKLTGTGVRATADKELTITLTHPAAYFPAVLTLPALVPLRDTDVARGGENWTEPGTYIGNGPFALASWRHNERLVFVPDRYYRTPPKLKQWTKVIAGSDASVALSAYRHDEIGSFAFGGQAGALLREVQADPALKQDLIVVNDVCTNTIGFNGQRAPFDDPVVRLAFAKALDREAYVRDVRGGIDAPALSLLPPGLPAHDAADTAQRFDPAEARKLLASSRYAGSDVLRSIVIPHNLGAFRRAQAEWLRDQWNTVLGVRVTTQQLDEPTRAQLFSRIETTPQVFPFGWCADYPDPQNFLSLLFRSGGQSSVSRSTGFADSQFDRRVDEADSERDPARRQDLYRRASRILSEGAVLAFLTNNQTYGLRKPWLKGVIDSPFDFGELGLQGGTEAIFIAKHR
jgi:oligopeptide transport system substrate-binding protein